MKKENKKEKKNKIPTWAIILIIIGVLVTVLPMLVVIVFFAYLGIKDEMREDHLEEDLKMINSITAEYDEKNNTYSVKGYLKNTDNEPYYGVFIEYNLYDKDGNIIGIATADLNKLNKNETWHFSAEYTGENAKDITSYKLTQINGDDELY